MTSHCYSSDVTSTCPLGRPIRLQWTQVEAWVRVAWVNATETSRIAAWQAVVGVLPSAIVFDERFLRHGEYLGGRPAWLLVVRQHGRQTAGLIRSWSMLSVLVLARVAAAADRRLAGVTTSVVVRVDSVIVIACQFAAIMRQEFRISDMLIEFCGD